MTGLLDTDALADVFAAAFDWIYGDAVYSVDAASTGSVYDPTPGEPAKYDCKGQIDEWSSRDRTNTLVSVKDWKVILLRQSLRGADGPIEPIEGGRVTIRGITLTVSGEGGSAPAVSSDPARATWVLRCKL